MQDLNLDIPKSIDQFLQTSCKKVGSKPMWSVLEGSGSSLEWKQLTGDQAWSRIDELKSRLQLAGVDSNSRLAMIGEISLDWMSYFFAALRCGATVSPLDIKLSSPELHSVLDQYRATHILCSPAFAGEIEAHSSVQNMATRLIVFGEFERLSIEAVQLAAVEKKPIFSERAQLIIYTSGTLGTAKGVVIPPDRVFFEIAALASGSSTPAHYRAVFSIMPLNHIYGVTAGLFYYMWTGLELCQAQSLGPDVIAKVLKEKSVQQMVTVPLLLKMLRNGILAKIEQKPLPVRLLIRFVILVNGRLKSKWIARTVFDAVRSALAPSLERIVCGGAPLDPKYEDFFQALGWRVYPGYGLTETGPVISVNTERASRRGSVGRALRGVEVKIEKDGSEERAGEILTKGPHVFSHYENAPALTQEVLSNDGWFKTGDRGFVDRDGFLFIVGRIKSMIVLPSGKKIQPEEIEERLVESTHVKDVCVLGLGDDKVGVRVVAVVLLEDTSIDVSDKTATAPALADLQELSKTIAPYKRPQEFWFRSTPFPMTSSQKIKRHQLQRELQKELQKEL